MCIRDSSYCDWFIEFLKPVFISKNKKNLEEARNMLAYIQSNILVLLHPFIPFFTEKVWQDFNFEEYYKTPLLLKNWDLKSQSTFSKSHHKISWLIDLVSAIRSTKVNLNISPGEFIEISTSELSTKSLNIVNDNLDVFKTLGRVSKVNSAELNKNGVKIIIGGETVILYFCLLYTSDAADE